MQVSEYTDPVTHEIKLTATISKAEVERVKIRKGHWWLRQTGRMSDKLMWWALACEGLEIENDKE